MKLIRLAPHQLFTGNMPVCGRYKYGGTDDNFICQRLINGNGGSSKTITIDLASGDAAELMVTSQELQISQKQVQLHKIIWNEHLLR